MKNKSNFLSSAMRQGPAMVVGTAALFYFYAPNKTVLMSGQSVTLAVVGCDPSDIFSGYYLRYSVKYQSNLCKIGFPEVCACLEQTASRVSNTRASSSDEASRHCQVFIRGDCSPGRFKAGIERYYIPEDKRRSVALIPEGATI